jgi:hypothetical protein
MHAAKDLLTIAGGAALGGLAVKGLNATFNHHNLKSHEVKAAAIGIGAGAGAVEVIGDLYDTIMNNGN